MCMRQQQGERDGRHMHMRTCAPQTGYSSWHPTMPRPALLSGDMLRHMLESALQCFRHNRIRSPMRGAEEIAGGIQMLAPTLHCRAPLTSAMTSSRLIGLRSTMMGGGSMPAARLHTWL